MRVEVKPSLLAWARERSGIDPADLARRFPRLEDWEQGKAMPTLRQIEGFARATHTPVGFLFLEEPPDEQVPIPDFRTMGDVAISRPSPDLLATIFQCQQRQEWYRTFAQVTREDPVEAVGSLTTATTVVDAAEAMRGVLGFAVDERGPTWTDALRRLVDQAEELGVLVMINGVVGSDTHRRLDPREFRGFALADPLAPVVFVNGADSKAAQIFTLVHELAHLWLGESALSDADLVATSQVLSERWCNEVAAEFLVPLQSIAADVEMAQPLAEELQRLARRFKVSTLVVLRRIHDAGFLGWDEYRATYKAELARLVELLGERGTAGGGNYYNTQPVRVSKRFARALIISTLEGQTLYRDAFQMLGFRKTSTFHGLARQLDVG